MSHEQESATTGREQCANLMPACGEKCGASVALLISRWGMSFACVLPKGHEGEHQQGGTCFKHGEYVGEKCPQWPRCMLNAAIASVTSPPPAPVIAPSDRTYTKAEVRALVGIALEQAAEVCGAHTHANLILALDPPAITELERRDARVRLEEATWWRIYAVFDMQCDDTVDCDCKKCQRIAALQATADAGEKEASDV